MTVWFRRDRGMDSNKMRQIADSAGVSWDYQTVIYRGQGVGYADGNPADVTALQDAAESILGYRLVEIDAPPESDTAAQ